MQDFSNRLGCQCFTDTRWTVEQKDATTGFVFDDILDACIVAKSDKGTDELLALLGEDKLLKCGVVKLDW
jgi:hypothetical protein